MYYNYKKDETDGTVPSSWFSQGCTVTVGALTGREALYTYIKL
jgi:hypothetical protein